MGGLTSSSSFAPRKNPCEHGSPLGLSSVIVSLHHLVLVVVHVEVELRGVFMAETVNLQVDDDVALQNAVVMLKPISWRSPIFQFGKH